MAEGVVDDQPNSNSATTDHYSLFSFTRLRQFPRTRVIFGITIGSLLSAILIIGTNTINGVISIAFVVSTAAVGAVYEYLVFFITDDQRRSIEEWLAFRASPVRLGVPCAIALVFMIPIQASQIVASGLILGSLLAETRDSRFAQAVAVLFAVTPIISVADMLISGSGSVLVVLLGLAIVSPWGILLVQDRRQTSKANQSTSEAD